MSDLLTIPRWLLDPQQKLDLGCASECDCGTINGHPHEPDCHWWDKCDEGRWCDAHRAEAMAEHAYLRNVPRHQVYGDAQAEQERNQELRDAGRGSVVLP